MNLTTIEKMVLIEIIIVEMIGKEDLVKGSQINNNK